MADYVLAFTGAELDVALTLSDTTQLNYDQTVPAINASVNVTSVTDTSAGQFTINFTTAYANVNFFAVNGNGDQSNPTVWLKTLCLNTRTTGSLTCCSSEISTASNPRQDLNSDLVNIEGTLV